MKHLFALAIGLAATQGQALSCVRPDPVVAFLAAMAAPETYVVLRGTFAEAEIYNPPPVVKAQPYAVPVWFIGQTLGRDGFSTPLETPLTVQITCAGPWCGSSPASPLIAFARVEDGAYTVEANACGTWIFAPDHLTEALLVSCLRGDACVPRDALD